MNTADGTCKATDGNMATEMRSPLIYIILKRKNHYDYIIIIFEVLMYMFLLVL